MINSTGSCKLAVSSWWWTWMTVLVARTFYHSPQVWSWSGGYRQWGPSNSEDSHQLSKEENSQHHSGWFHSIGPSSQNLHDSQLYMGTKFYALNQEHKYIQIPRHSSYHAGHPLLYLQYNSEHTDMLSELINTQYSYGVAVISSFSWLMIHHSQKPSHACSKINWGIYM